MQAVRLLALVAALAAVLMLATSGPGTRLDLWDWRMGLTLMKWSMFAGFGAAAVALVLLVIPRTRGRRPSVLVAALVLGVIAGAPTIAMMTTAKRLPYIHDVTTDTRDPPAFVALEAARRASPNGLAYGGAEGAAAPHRGHPHIPPPADTAPPAPTLTRAPPAPPGPGFESP